VGTVGSQTKAPRIGAATYKEDFVTRWRPRLWQVLRWCHQDSGTFVRRYLRTWLALY